MKARSIRAGSNPARSRGAGRPPKTLTIVFFLAIQGCTQELRIFEVGLNSKLFPAGSASTSEGYLSSENKQIVIDSILKLHSLTKDIKLIFQIVSH